MSILIVFLIVVLSLVLIKSADITVLALKRVAHGAGVFGLSAIIVALGTSFPELFVGITSGLEKSSNLALGVVIGSNIANIALISGITALIAGKVQVYGRFMRRDVWIALVCGALPFLLGYDGFLGKVDGLVLVFLYIGYAVSFFVGRGFIDENGEFFIFRFLRRFNHSVGEKSKDLARIFIGISLMLFAADSIVKFSRFLGEKAGVPVFLIGLFILAVGATLPELAFSLRSLKDHEPSMFFGNILGSIIANSTLILGVTALIEPVYIYDTNKFITAFFGFLFVFLLFYLFIRTKFRLERWEGLVLVIIYAVFVMAELA